MRDAPGVGCRSVVVIPVVVVVVIMVSVVIMVMIMVVAMFVIMIVVTIIVLVVSTPMVTVVIMMFVMRDVLVVVPIIPHKVDPAAAGIVLRAMLAPVLLMSRRDMQVNRRCGHILRRLRDDHGLRIDHRRARSAADIDLTVEARLADGD